MVRGEQALVIIHFPPHLPLTVHSTDKENETLRVGNRESDTSGMARARRTKLAIGWFPKKESVWFTSHHPRPEISSGPYRLSRDKIH